MATSRGWRSQPLSLRPQRRGGVDPSRSAEELAGAPSVMDALASYDKRWRPFARRMQQTAAMLQRLCGIERVRTLRVRDALLAGLAQFPRLSEEGIRGPWPQTSEGSDPDPCLETPAKRPFNGCLVVTIGVSVRRLRGWI
jgi:hypothetical protein